MEHVDPAKAQSATPVDPVCGMKVNPATAKYRTHHEGKDYFFCCGGCLAKFQADPQKILSSPPKPMGSGLISLGTPVVSRTGEGARPSTLTMPGEGARHSTGTDRRTHVCPMCPEVRQVGPGPCPSCGMALEPESPALPATQDRIHLPDASRDREVGAGELSDLRDGAGAADGHAGRRESRAAGHDAAVLGQPDADRAAAGDCHGEHAFAASIHGGRPWSWGLPWLELLLATPVVLWGGWPFFQRGWTSIVNRSTQHVHADRDGHRRGVRVQRRGDAVSAESFRRRSAAWATGRMCTSKRRRRLSRSCCWGRCWSCGREAGPRARFGRCWI